MQCDLEERLTVMGDRDHLYRVVYNLTDNAVKFIEDGGTLRLKVHQEGQLCVFAISNTGIGISAEDLRGLWRKAIPDTMGGSINAPPELDYIFAKK